jgi:flagellar biosynthetic protein FliO
VEFTQRMLEAAAVLALMGALLWYLRRRGLVSRAAGRAERRLEKLERLPLDPQHTVYLVRAGERALVIGCSPGGCAVLDRLPVERGVEPAGARP